MLIITKTDDGNWEAELRPGNPQEPRLYILSDPEKAKSPADRGGWTIFVSEELVEVAGRLTLTEFKGVADWSMRRWYNPVYDEELTSVLNATDGPIVPSVATHDGDGVSRDAITDGQ